MMTQSRSLRPLALCLMLCPALIACSGGEATPEAAGRIAGDSKSVPGDSKSVADVAGDAALPGAESLLAEVAAAMCGGDKFAGLTSVYTESTLNMGSMGLTGTAKTWWRGGDFYNESEMAGVGQMKIGGLGGASWADDPISGLRALTGKEAEQAKWSSTLCLAHDWKRYFTKAETTAVKEVEGQRLAEITLTSALGDTVVLRVDMASKLPVSESFEQASPMGSMPATVYFKDYRDIEGMKFPYEQVVDASLTKAVSTITKLELNVAVDDSKFAMPGSTQAVTPGALVDPAKVEPAKVAEPATPAKGEPVKVEKKAAAG